MVEREVTPHLPTSGQIIGALVTRLGLKEPSLQSRTARRYFAGRLEELVKDETEDEIIRDVARALSNVGFVPPRQDLETEEALAQGIDALLRWHANHWDQLRSFLRPRMPRVMPSHLSSVWAAYVRLTVIDLAIRLAAHLHLTGSSPSALELLDWTMRTARGSYLNQKRSQAGLSLERLAEKLDVDDHTVDAWMYKGARPSDDNIVKIGEQLGNRRGIPNAQVLVRDLRALYWLSDVVDLLAEHISAEAVDTAIGRLRRYADEAHQIIDRQVPDEERSAALPALVEMGVNCRYAKPLLSALIDQESDPEWREDLSATGMGWIRRVLAVNLRIHQAEVTELIQNTEGRLLEDWDISNPDAYAHYQRSMELQMQGRLDEALAEVVKAAKLDPMDPANHFTIGSVKGGLGADRGDIAMVNEGIEACWLAVTLDPNWILPWTEIGLIHLRVGRAAEAVKHLLAVRPECGPLDPRYHSTLADAYWRLGQPTEALAAYEAALELDPEDLSDLIAASEIALEIGDRAKYRRYSRRARHLGESEETEKVLELLREFRKPEPTGDATDEHDRKIAVMDAVIRLDPDDTYAYLSRGLAHFAKGDEASAMADLDAVIRLDPSHAGARYLRGVLFGNRKQWDQMIADMSEAIRLTPDDAKAYYYRGMAYGERDMLDESFADMCEAIRLDPNHADAHRVRGDCLRYKRQYDGAIADFDTALRLDPENAAAYLGRGAVYRRKGNPDQAITDYDATLRFRPEDPFAYRFRGDAYLAKGDYDQAIADFTRSLKTSPHDEIAYRSRGKAHLFKEQFEAALADFEAAVQADPNSGVATYARGLTRQLLGDADGAEEDFKHARELGYDDSDDGLE